MWTVNPVQYVLRLIVFWSAVRSLLRRRNIGIWILYFACGYRMVYGLKQGRRVSPRSVGGSRCGLVGSSMHSTYLHRSLWVRGSQVHQPFVPLSGVNNINTISGGRILDRYLRRIFDPALWPPIRQPTRLRLTVIRAKSNPFVGHGIWWILFGNTYLFEKQILRVYMSLDGTSSTS